MWNALEAQRNTGVSKNSRNTSELGVETVWEVLAKKGGDTCRDLCLYWVFIGVKYLQWFNKGMAC